jgi:ABC-type bacteriocin/lantibiotic exporter with double-glycine peptidase domain
MKIVLAFAVVAAAAPLEVPFFQQQKNGCGAASVAMVMHYWKPGTPSAAEVYRELYQPEPKGIPLADMRRYLEAAGFRAFTLRGEWSDLDTHVAKGRPIIVGLKPRRSGRLHFAVVVGLDGDSLWLNDPTRKRPHRVKRSEFQKQWDLADRWMLLASPSVL